MGNKWPIVSLQDILTLERRPVKIKPTVEYAEIGIYSFGRGIFHKPPRTGFEVGNKKLYLIKEGDFIFQITFAWEGAVALASSAENGMYGSTRFPTFRVNEEICYPKFLLNYFKTNEGRHQLVKISPGSAGRNRVLSLKRLREVTVPLPPLDEQHRIVARIEELAAKVEQAQQLREVLHKRLDSLLFSVLNNITEGADFVPMEDIALLVRRPVEVKPMEEYHEIGIYSFGRGVFHKSPVDGFSLGNKRIYKIKAGDLLFSNVFAWEGAIAVARKKDDGRVGSHRFLTCVLKADKALAPFLCYYFLSKKGLEKIGEASPGSAGRNRTLNIKALMQIKVPLALMDEQKYFCNLQAKVQAVKRHQATTAAKLDALLPSILDRAFKGEM